MRKFSFSLFIVVEKEGEGHVAYILPLQCLATGFSWDEVMSNTSGFMIFILFINF